MDPNKIYYSPNLFMRRSYLRHDCSDGRVLREALKLTKFNRIKRATILKVGW